jgi:hypothetical protein
MSEWFKENRWLGTFLVVFGLTTLLALWFLFSAKSNANDAATEFTTAATERGRLERLDPFPSEANYRKLKVHIDNYAASLDKLKENLKSHVIAPTPELKPNEFQMRLRQAMVSVAEKARANRVKVPDNFALGFEEFTVGLPNTTDAPVLGQELAQAELLANILIDARVDSIGAFKRVANLPPGTAAATTKKPAANAPKLVERGIVDLTFTAAPSVMRRVLNQIASSPQQFYVVRTLHVRNEKDKGPPREQASVAAGVSPAGQTNAAGTAAATATGTAKSNAALTFIVGNEHIETSARVELVRFVY